MRSNKKYIIASTAIFLIAIVVLFFCVTKNNKSQQSTEQKINPELITYNEHIAPIIHKNCTSCHRKGEAGPFELISYNDVSRKAKTIALVTLKRYMPPWPADRTYSHFANEKGLTDYEIDLIQNWVKFGKKEGDKSKTPQYPTFASGSQLGKPDLVISASDSFKIEGNNKDHFIVMKIGFELPENKYVKAIEFVPGNRKLLHHVNAHLLSYEFDKKKNVYDGENAVNQENMDIPEVHKRIGVPQDDGSYPLLTPSICNYLPGVTAAVYPNGIGGYTFTKKGGFYLKDIHYGPTPINQYDKSSFNIFFMDEAPKRPIHEFIMGTLGVSTINPPLSIPPNEIKTFTTQYTLKKDISLLTVNPHMHLLGKSFWAFAVKQNGDTIPLIRINNWDFRWQYFYTFKKMMKLETGTTIYVHGVFDNTKNNPNNPFSPPQTVGEREGSMRTSDEMFQFIINYLPYQQGDENISLENEMLK